MAIEVKLKIDPDSIQDLEAELGRIIKSRLGQLKRDMEINTFSRTRLDDLIDVLIEKGLIQRSDLIG